MWPFSARKLAQEGNKSRAILDAKFHVPHDFSSAVARNGHFFSDPALRGHLASQLLLYDTVVVLTHDLAIVPTLISWLGLTSFRDGLENGTFRFIRLPGLLGYVGNGNGISAFTITPGTAGPFLWWQESLFGTMEAGLELQLRHAAAFIERKERGALVGLLSECTSEAVIANDEFIKNIANETYADVLGSPEHVAYLQASLPAGKFSLQALPTIKPNEIVVASMGRGIESPIDLVLKIANLNLTLLLAGKTSGVDLLVPEGAESLLRAKLARSSLASSLTTYFSALLDLTGLPDVRQLVVSDTLSLQNVWKLCQKRRSRRFREWLRSATLDSARDLERAYVATLGKSTAVQGAAGRTIRFSVSSAAGVANPIVGFAVGAADSFLVDRLLSGYSPKLLIDDLAKLLPS